MTGDSDWEFPPLLLQNPRSDLEEYLHMSTSHPVWSKEKHLWAYWQVCYFSCVFHWWAKYHKEQKKKASCNNVIVLGFSLSALTINLNICFLSSKGSPGTLLSSSCSCEKKNLSPNFSLWNWSAIIRAFVSPTSPPLTGNSNKDPSK